MTKPNGRSRLVSLDQALDQKVPPGWLTQLIDERVRAGNMALAEVFEARLSTFLDQVAERLDAAVVSRSIVEHKGLTLPAKPDFLNPTDPD